MACNQLLCPCHLSAAYLILIPYRHLISSTISIHEQSLDPFDPLKAQAATSVRPSTSILKAKFDSSTICARQKSWPARHQRRERTVSDHSSSARLVGPCYLSPVIWTRSPVNNVDDENLPVVSPLAGLGKTANVLGMDAIVRPSMLVGKRCTSCR